MSYQVINHWRSTWFLLFLFVSSAVAQSAEHVVPDPEVLCVVLRGAGVARVLVVGVVVRHRGPERQELEREEVHEEVGLEAGVVDGIVREAQGDVHVVRDWMREHHQRGDQNGQHGLQEGVYLADVQGAHAGGGVELVVEAVKVLPQVRAHVLNPVTPVQSEVTNEQQCKKLKQKVGERR